MLASIKTHISHLQADFKQGQAAHMTISTTPIPRSLALLVTGWLLCVLQLIGAIVLPFLIGEFEEMFRSFGADLPRLTRFFIHGRFAWGLFPFIALVLSFILSIRTQISRRHQNVIGTLLALVFLAFTATVAICVYSLYLPIMNMGAVV